MGSVIRVKAADTQGAINALEKDGAVILSDFTSIEDVENVNTDMLKHWQSADKHPIDFYPDKVQTCYAVFGRSETLREKWTLNEHFRKIYQHFLRNESIPYQGEKQDVVVNEPILSTSVSVNIQPGAKSQLLHRDDMTWQQHHPDRTRYYTKENECCIAALVPGVDFTEANGATRLILGSHLWEHSKRGKPEDTVCAEMKRGEALLILGSIAHGGGANNAESNRVLHSVFLCRAYLRPENNIMPLFSREEVEKWSPEAQYLGGYQMGALFLGHSDAEDPLKVLPRFIKA